MTWIEPSYINTRVISIFKNSHPEVFCVKDVVRNFTKFTTKHLRQSFLFNKVAGVFYKNTSGGCFCIFPEYFASINKFFILARNLGTSLSFYDSGRVPAFKTSTRWLQVQSFIILMNSGNIVVKSKLPPHNP